MTSQTSSKNAISIVSNLSSVSDLSLVANRQPAEVDKMKFSSALEETKFGKINYLLIIVSGVVLANVLLETAQISFILPVSQCDLQLSIKEKGILCAMSYAGIISSSHLWGFLADTKGRRKIICPTLIIGFIFSVMSSFASEVWVLCLLRFCTGFLWNTGRSKNEFPVRHLTPEEDTMRKDVGENQSFLKTIWNQTAPLFSKEYIKVTLLICFIQFWLFVVTNGMYMWFPQITNYLVEFQNNYPNNSTLICDLFRSKQNETYGLQNDGEMKCVEKLELALISTPS
uniref:Major facilitator superfamily (MFS) profile domain-containing protein n=1 Tax=Megaselia scalaris TaxID=36166 RepID=T1GNQ0_MEGSC